MSDKKAAGYGWNREMKVSLHDKIKEDLKGSMLNRENEVRDTLRLIMGEYPKLTIAMTLESGKKTTRVKRPEEITDDDLLTIIRSLVKSEKVVLEYKKEQSSPYLDLLMRYLPKMADENDIVSWIKENIDLSEFKNPMQAMGTVMKHFGKLADGRMVKEILSKI